MSHDVSLVTKHFANANEGFVTTLGSSILSGAATVPLTSVSGLVNGTIFIAIIEPGGTKQQTFTGTVDTAGVQITGVVWTRGSNADHSAGVTIVDYVSGTYINMFTKGLLAAGLNQDGTQTPVVKTSINDVNGNEVIKTPATTSAVNEITVTNAATGNAPSISATGGDSNVNLNLRGKGLAKTVNIGAGAVNIFPYDYVASGCVWTADAAGSTKLASMTAGVVVINGNPITVAAVTSRTFTASKDVYVDVLDNGDGTGLLVYTDGTTNAASGSLASNSIRLAIVVVGASNIAAAASINQGQETSVLPIASSIPYSVADSLGNLICPRDPNRKLIGYVQRLTQFDAGTNALTDVTGLSITVIVPTGRKIKLTAFGYLLQSGTIRQCLMHIRESTTDQVPYAETWSAITSPTSTMAYGVVTATAGTHTYKVSIECASGANVSLGNTSFLMAELE